MLSKEPSKLFVCINMKVVRLVLGMIMLIGMLLFAVVYSMAGFSGVAQNKNNKITTANMSIALMTTDKPVNILPNSSGQSTKAPLPTTIAELFTNGNSFISIDDDKNTTRRFFEYQGKGEITDVQPGFRQQRPLIVQNNSNADIDYSVEFLTREILKAGLSSAFFFNYTKVGDNIPNSALKPNNATALIAGTTIENTGSTIQKIGQGQSVRIKANSSHIYIVDMGILSTAGNTIQGSGMLLDMVLASSYVGNTSSHTSSQVTSSSSSSSDSSSPTSSSPSSTPSSPSSTPSSSSNSDPFADYIDYNTIVDSGSYGGGGGTSKADAYIVGNLQEFKHFIEDTTTTRNTWVRIDFNVSKVKNIPDKVLLKKAKIAIDGTIQLSQLDISAEPPTVSPINPFQGCTYYYQNIVTTNHVMIFQKISYRGEFVS